jgi:alginate O-acetyltransferase complex protein AlgI
VLFNSFPFLFVFLPLVLVGFFALRRQGHRIAFVVAASYVFYAYEEWWFPALMITTTLVSFVGGLAVARLPERRPGRKWVLAGAIAVCLGMLGVFKYAAFASGYASDLLATITGTGLPGLDDLTANILLPAGISFYTFEAISYLVDVHRGTIRAERNPLRYAFFISYFPHLIAGPIVRYSKLGPQLRELYRLDWDMMRSGVLLFSIGLAKKVLLADGLAFRANPLLDNPGSLGMLDAWAAMLAYSFQIYFDFSAYSDMALGLARMMGIELPWNFDRPYRAASPAEFWRRWHVTLSSWLRDYLYIPLGGNRKGPLRRDANLLATMGLGGLWHGASLSFALWGLYHGGLLVAHRRLSAFPLRLPRPAAVALTFVLVTVGWVFFRETTTEGVGSMLSAMAGLNGIGQPAQTLVPYLLVAGALMWGLPEEWRWRMPEWGALRVAAVAVLTVVAIISIEHARKFIYFQF